jgi:hypothetical protein
LFCTRTGAAEEEQLVGLPKAPSAGIKRIAEWLRQEVPGLVGVVQCAGAFPFTSSGYPLFIQQVLEQGLMLDGFEAARHRLWTIEANDF